MKRPSHFIGGGGGGGGGENVQSQDSTKKELHPTYSAQNTYCLACTELQLWQLSSFMPITSIHSTSHHHFNRFLCSLAYYSLNSLYVHSYALPVPTLTNPCSPPEIVPLFSPHYKTALPSTHPHF